MWWTIPPQPILTRTLAKTLGFWIVLRGLLVSVGVAVPEPVVSVLIVVVVLVLLVVDMTMVRERLFIENLGVGRMGILRTAAVAALILEVGTSLVILAVK